MSKSKNPVLAEAEVLKNEWDEIPSEDQPGRLTEFFKRLATQETSVKTITRTILGPLLGPRQFDRMLRESEERECPQQDEEEVKAIARFDGLVDIALEDGAPVFLVEKDGKLRAFKRHEVDGQPVVPPGKDKILWPLSDVNQVRDAITTVEEWRHTFFDDIVNALKSVCHLPSEGYYVLFAAWILHTYRIEHCHYSPMIVLVGPPEHGKSRTGRALIYLAYRGFLSESLNPAYLFRLADIYRIALFLDVVDIEVRLHRQDSRDIIMARFEKGLRVTRINRHDAQAFDSFDCYEVFGATVIGVNEEVHELLASRSITLVMQPAENDFQTPVTEELFIDLRAKLLAYRFGSLSEPLQAISKPAKGRLGDILRPIWQVVLEVAPEKVSALDELIPALEKQRLEARSMSLQAKVVRALINASDAVEHSVVPLSDITGCVNSLQEYRFYFTEKRIAGVVDGLGLEKAKTKDGNTGVIYDMGKIRALAERYGLIEFFDARMGTAPKSPDTLAQQNGDSPPGDDPDSQTGFGQFGKHL